MRSQSLKIALVFAYFGLIVTLFFGVKEFEKFAREQYFQVVSKGNVTEVFQNSVDKCVLGIYRPELPYSFSTLRQIEEGIDERFTIVSFYQAWGDGDNHSFPAPLMNQIKKEGLFPVLTWEPWVNMFRSETLRPMPQRQKGLLRDIADGFYDQYITDWAREAVRWGKPFFLRFAHEMSNPQYPWSPENENSPEDFIDAWNHVRSIFRLQGAKNVLWVWSPYKRGDIVYYPGDEQVDWVALDIFNYGELLAHGEWARWLTFDQLLSPIYAELGGIDKPFMIAEVGCIDMGGSREVWYREMFSQITEKFEKVKAVIFFDNPADRTSGRKIDWSLSEYELEEIREALPSTCFEYNETYTDLLTEKRR